MLHIIDSEDSKYYITITNTQVFSSYNKSNMIFRTWTEEDKEFALQPQIADLVSSKAMRFD